MPRLNDFAKTKTKQFYQDQDQASGPSVEFGLVSFRLVYFLPVQVVREFCKNLIHEYLFFFQTNYRL
jgi:hypothetical protein